MKFNVGDRVVHKDHPGKAWTVQKYTSETEVFCMRVDVISSEFKVIEAVFNDSDIKVSEVNTVRTSFK